MSGHLSAQQLAELKALLEADRERLLRRAAPSIGAGAGRSDEEPTDMQEKATEEASRRASLALDTRARGRLADIDEALRRMDEGTYGICDETGEPIAYARLRSEPTTRYTVEALELLEEERARRRSTSLERDDGEAY